MQTITVMEAAWATVEQPRTNARAHVDFLAHRLRLAQRELPFPLVHDEDGITEVDVIGALYRLYDNDEPTPDEPLEAFKLADVVATGIATAHEMTTGELVPEDDQAFLTTAFMEFRLRDPALPGAYQPRHLAS
ncbi:MAG TPA: hypothetical protein VJR27_00435 [Candidatus Saccharimonadales bacterium]|nr:hypothetical protein [Candidatus Saccharimonadales bacterium]